MRMFTSIKKMCLMALLFVAGNMVAQDVIFSEDFSKCTATNPNNPTTEITQTMDEYTSTPGWVGEKCYSGAGAIKAGTSKLAGSITTPAIDLSDATATYTLTFKACAWKGDPDFLSVQVDDNEAVKVEVG